MVKCIEHGTELSVSHTTDRGKPRVYTYCLECRRAKYTSGARYGGPRCGKGHLKTPWTWRHYGSGWRCLTCEYERRKKRRKSA